MGKVRMKLQTRFPKDLDEDDYMLNPDIFAPADILWGPHTIGRFSSSKT